MGNVKLIIEIPEWYYEETKEFKHPTLIDKAILNGTTLDSAGEYIKKSDLMANVVTETLSDYTEDDVVYADVINSLPTYSYPERPKGEWIETYDEIDARYSRHGYKCPKCDKFAHYFVGGSEDWWDIEKPNFCPNCGADMRGEVE